MKKAILITLCLAIYLNIGWAFGTYMHKNVLTHEPQTVYQYFWSGAGDFVTHHDIHDNYQIQIHMMIIWPLTVVIIIASWICYGIYYILWLIFAGGIAKLFGFG